jgi:bifunctional non-homologous end joining protein LigD
MTRVAARNFSFVEPMKALAVQELPEGDWLYEVKLDGYRALAFKDGKEVRLVSRNQKAFNYPELLDALKSLPAERVILDGEIVALDEKGRSSFQLLQVFKSSEQRLPLVYYVFDFLFLEGKDLTGEPLSARRQMLAKLLEKAPENIRLSDELRGSKEELLRRVATERFWITSTRPQGGSTPKQGNRLPVEQSRVSRSTKPLTIRGFGEAISTR